jgi:hypothetical protein
MLLEPVGHNRAKCRARLHQEKLLLHQGHFIDVGTDRFV